MINKGRARTTEYDSSAHFGNCGSLRKSFTVENSLSKKSHGLPVKIFVPQQT